MALGRIHKKDENHFVQHARMRIKRLEIFRSALPKIEKEKALIQQGFPKMRSPFFDKKVRKRTSFTLSALFPCDPEQCVVGSVVRNAPQPLPVPFTDRDGERSSCP